MVSSSCQDAASHTLILRSLDDVRRSSGTFAYFMRSLSHLHRRLSSGARHVMFCNIEFSTANARF